MTETHPQNRRLGYTRVSTCGLTLDAQLEQLGGCGVHQEFPRENDGSAQRPPPTPFKMLATLAPGEVVTVTRIDRLARSTFDLVRHRQRIVDANAQFRLLAEPWADTRHQHRAAHDCRVGRIGGRGARPYPHPHR